MKLHVVDGTFELFRGYYGARGYRTQAGREVGACRSLLRNMSTLIQTEGVTHIGVAFDHVIESFRNDLFDGYKTGEGIDPDLWQQFPLAEEVCRALGLVVWPMIDFEADDALAAAAHQLGDDFDQVVLCSPDKDLAQMVVDPKIIQWDRLRDKWYDEKAIKTKFGINPQSIPDYLGLVGDDADGIPGVPKWGAKSTATLLAEYGSVENIPLDENDWSVKVRGAKSLGENLREFKEEWPLYKKLATLRTDVPLEESADDLRWDGVNEDLLNVVMTEMDDAIFADRYLPKLMER